MIFIRLFLALNFSSYVKAQINEIVGIFKANSAKGRFVSEGNIHLTLEFLGEVQKDKLSLIYEAMNLLDIKPFTLNLNKTGLFKRREGNIYWLSVEKNDTLLSLQHKLHQNLIGKGFELEAREYRPHITIGRKVELKDGFNTDELNEIISKITIDIDSVDLMKSEFINGNLKYTVLYSKPLT